MKVVVIGSGIIGVMTAYFLRQRGHEVNVIDREAGVGRATSYANGALLTPSMPEPWNTPGCWRALLGSLGRSDAPLQLRPGILHTLAGWGVDFLRNSSVANFERNTLSNLRLARHSMTVMESIRQQSSIDYDRTTPGSLRLFRDITALNRAAKSANRLLDDGLCFRQLSVAETVEKEPALAPIAARLKGAIHYENDETGDAYRFCVGLAALAERQGVKFCFDSEVSSLELSARRLTAVSTSRGRFVADLYVVAAGSYSAPLLRKTGIHLPVRPAKGYSLTIDCPLEEPRPCIPIIDDSLHAVIVPMKKAIRVAGKAEFAGFDVTLPPARIRSLADFVKKVLPSVALDLANAKPWCGLRAMSADGVPIIGPTRLTNVFVNTGHGHLGWTMAAGSAELLTHLMCGEPPSIDPTPFALDRFTATR